jgi:hypothetical protein
VSCRDFGGQLRAGHGRHSLINCFPDLVEYKIASYDICGKFSVGSEFWWTSGEGMQSFLNVLPGLDQN